MRIFSIFLISITLFFSSFNFSFASCKPSTSGWASSLKNFLSDCSSDTTGIGVGKSEQTGKEHEQFKAKVISVVEKALGWAALFAILAMVVSGIIYTTSYWNDQKLTKAKNTAIFAGLGLFITLIAFPFVNAIVTFIYNLGWPK